ncbi:MAG: hypothetical protein Q7U74_15905 [Saprospiraceae bacterium]|nr:hypothetical protein [Saprospiraceae bacterium]
MEADINGSSLLTEAEFEPRMPKLLFGKATKILGNPCQQRKKYSDAVTVRHKATGEIFTLYMCYGQTRIGGFKENSSSLGELLAGLNPAKYAHCVGQPVSELTKNRLSGGPV